MIGFQAARSGGRSFIIGIVENRHIGPPSGLVIRELEQRAPLSTSRRRCRYVSDEEDCPLRKCGWHENEGIFVEPASAAQSRDIQMLRRSGRGSPFKIRGGEPDRWVRVTGHGLKDPDVS